MLDRGDPVVAVELIEGDGPDEFIDFGDRLAAFDYEDVDHGKDSCNILLRNWNLSLLEDRRFARGQKLRVSWGYSGGMAPPRDVVIKKIHGLDLLQIACEGKVTELDQEVKVRAWEQMTVGEIAAEIAFNEQNLDGKFVHIVEPDGITHECINQHYSDARFLAKLARDHGCVFCFNHTGFHFHPRDMAAAPRKVLIYRTDPGRGDIIKLVPDSDFSRSIGKVVIKSRDPNTGEEFEVEASNQDTDRDGLGKAWEVGNPATVSGNLAKRNATAITRYVSGATKDQAKLEAQKRFKLAAQFRFKLTAYCHGDPVHSARNVYELQGAGQYLEGNYYCKRAKHSIKGSYQTELYLIRDSALEAPTIIDPEKSNAAINDQEVVDDSLLRPVVVWEDGPDGQPQQVIQWRDSRGNIVDTPAQP